jgi:flavin reductase (DIM6/NTAB) family NADH-FMN oxidoreductase RutF
VTDARLPGRNRPQTAPSGSFGGISTGASSRGQARVASGSDTNPTSDAIRAARRRWATGVCVVTTVDRAEEATLFRGATVSAFTVLSLEPPMVLIALEVGSRTAELLPNAGVFAVSVLDRAHEFLSDRFSGYGPQPDGRFTGLAHDFSVTGSPILSGTLAWFDCRVENVLTTGDHITVIGRVEAVGVGIDTDDPLINYEGAYRRIEGA